MKSFPSQHNHDSQTTVKTVLLLAAVTLNAFEFFIPRIPLFPWLKPGIANAVTIVWIIRYGGIDALLFTLLRIWTVGFYFGFSFLPFALSLSGGVVSTVSMALVWQTLGCRRLAGLAGMGVTGALFHNAGQLLAVYGLMARNTHIFYQAPVMIFASIFFGFMVGMLAIPLSSCADETFKRSLSTSHPAPRFSNGTPFVNAPASISAFIFCISLAFISNLYIVAAAAVAATLIAQFIEHGSWNVLFNPIRRFWLLFIAIAAFHLFFSYGKRIEAAPVFTYEGISAAALQCLRLWAWLQTASILRIFGFHFVFMYALNTAFHKRNDTLYAGMLALQYLPQVIDSIRKRAAESAALAVRHPVQWARQAISLTITDIATVIGVQDV